jgi:uncharacterized membrane protein
MEARAKLLGHPIHQMLIVLPLGLLSGVVIFDVIYLLSGGLQWATISYWLIPAGVLTGLLAALFGIADWTKIPRSTRAKSVGRRHGVGNGIVVLLFLASWLLRAGPVDRPGLVAILLTLAGGGLSMVTGWLGGELVNRLGVGVDDGAHLDAPSSLSGRPAAGVPDRSPGGSQQRR